MKGWKALMDHRRYVLYVVMDIPGPLIL